MGTEYQTPVMQEFIESIFSAAFVKADQALGEELLRKVREEKIELSELQKRRLLKLIGKTIRQSRLKRVRTVAVAVSKRVAIVIAAILLVGCTLVATVKAVREKVAELLFHFTPSYVEMEIDPADSTKPVANEPNLYTPGYIPEGFELVSSTQNDAQHILLFQNNDGLYIKYKGYTGAIQTNVDTENADRMENITISGNDALLVEEDGMLSLIWSRDSYYFVLCSQISEQELVRVAESIYIK